MGKISVELYKQKWGGTWESKSDEFGWEIPQLGFRAFSWWVQSKRVRSSVLALRYGRGLIALIGLHNNKWGSLEVYVTTQNPSQRRVPIIAVLRKQEGGKVLSSRKWHRKLRWIRWRITTICKSKATGIKNSVRGTGIREHGLVEIT